MKSSLLIAILICISSSYPQQKYINVIGTSEVVCKADQISFNVQIKVLSETIEDSKKKNDEYVSQLLGILKASGINTDDIEVSPITLGKNYEYSDRARVQKGFYSQTYTSFVLKDLSKYVILTDKLTTNDNFEIINSSYDISDYEIQNKKAYEDALKAALNKAKYMCSTMGVSHGEVLEIDETNNAPGYPNPYNVRTKEEGDTLTPFGNVTIRRTIRVKFAIK